MRPLRRVATIFNPETAPYYPLYLHTIEKAASSFAVELIAVEVHDDAEIERAISTLAREPGGGLIVFPDSFNAVHRRTIIALVEQYRLPAIYFFRYFAVDGGLISYGPDEIDLFRRTASYVDRILKGEKPADLPVQQPTKFQLVINLKTAKALGLTVPLVAARHRRRGDRVTESSNHPRLLRCTLQFRCWSFSTEMVKAEVRACPLQLRKRLSAIKTRPALCRIACHDNRVSPRRGCIRRYRP